MIANVTRVWRPVMWFAAVGLLAGGVLLSGLSTSADAQYWAPSASQSASLQRLVGELSAQFWYSYRGDVSEHRLRHEQLAEAIGAWNASPQNGADRQVMIKWLRDAMQASMPGSNQPMPATPVFTDAELPTPASATPSESNPDSKTNTMPTAVDASVPTASATETQTQPTEATSGESTGKSGAPEDSWFNSTGEEAPGGASPTDIPAGSNPFGDDPLGF
jgi:hypothetical protein